MEPESSVAQTISKNSDPKNSIQIQHVSIINLSSNCLSKVPDGLSDLINVETLDLSNNMLVDLPLSLTNLNRLKVLDLSKNNFKTIPKCINMGMGALTFINVSDNKNVNLNVQPYSKYIQTFLAARNRKCGTFPDWLVSQKFFNLREFRLDDTQFDVFSSIRHEGHMNLRVVSMPCCGLSSPKLQIIIKNMSKLEKLILGNVKTLGTENILTSVPIDAINNPALITELNLRATSIASVSADIKKLCNLNKLDLGLNHIFWLPDGFCELIHLKTFNIDGNGLIMLPDKIGDLKSLQEIRLDSNALSNLPASFEYLKNLKFADIYDNQMKEFPHILSEMHHLQGLDLDFNFFDTSEIKIGDTPYSVLRVNINKSGPEVGLNRDSRLRVAKISTNDGFSEFSEIHRSDSDDDDYINSTVVCPQSESLRVDENWDESTDPSDNEFDPTEIQEVSYVQRVKPYYPGGLGFCPDDLHPESIKAEVANLLAHGSLPTYTIEDGQFDDAD